jgi:uncharacterized membrane protein
MARVARTKAASPPPSEEPHERLARELLSCDYDKLTPIQRSVIDLVVTEAPTARDPNLRKDDRSFGQRLADQVADIGGSWGFIIGFGIVLAAWIGWNVFGLYARLAFDPYPFIFLNLMLSMLAAIQAPVIMMSQNRQDTKDRLRSELDYEVNRRAASEIQALASKVHLMTDKIDDIDELLRRQTQSPT